MTSRSNAIKDVQFSLTDLLGRDHTRAASEARAFLEGGNPESYQAIADQVVPFFSQAHRRRLDSLLDQVGKQVVSGLAHSSPGASTTAFNKATNTRHAPLAGGGFFRIGEDGRLYVITKSEHYHAPLGHDFPGYRLVENARLLGMDNATHNNTRGHATRLLERELVRVANGLANADTAAVDRAYATSEPHVLNRVLNLETGSLAVEAALKMMLARFYRQEDVTPPPAYSGRKPVFLVVADREGGAKANYHGTTILTQVLRGMWPDLAADMEDTGAYLVKPVRINDIDHFKTTLETWDTAPYKVAGFFHEIVLMNYGAVRLEPAFLRAAYELCHSHDVPVMCDEIQSCAWAPDVFLFREYGLRPDFVSLGKGFPGGLFASSRILFSSLYDNLNQFGALVTNGQEELSSIAYLVTLAWLEANGPYVASLGDYYHSALEEVGTRFPGLVETIEGSRHMSSIFFYDADKAVAVVKHMNAAGYDVSAQTYKAQCPPAILTKLPLIASYQMVDQFVGEIQEGLAKVAEGSRTAVPA